MTSFDVGETDRLLTTTRAVRKRLDLARPVERSVVLECLRVGLQAPSGGNVQPWRWMVVDDPDKRAGLAELYQRAYAPYIAMQKEAVVAAGGRDDNAILRSSDHLAEHLAEVPVHVIPCIEGRLDQGAPVALQAAVWGSLLPAAWSFMLAARSRGLGTCWTTLHLVFEQQAQELLGIPDDVTQGALIPVAHVLGGTDFKPGPRRDLDRMLHRDTW